jgi:2-methylaconitate cis-trans-isomerase PrpF
MTGSSSRAVLLVRWEEAAEDLARVRRRVFIEEQGVPEALEWDEWEAPSVHALVRHDGEAVATGRLLPTGNPVDVLDVPGHGRLEVSLVDIGNAHVFLRAADLGLAGTETAAEIDARGDLRALLERIRGLAAQRMGMLADGAQSVRETPATPLLAMVSPPADYRNALAGGTVAAAEVDLVSRLMFMQQMHKTYAGTSTVCTGVASRLPGTLVQRVARSHNRPAIRIGHPAGVIETESEIAPDGRVLRATLGRTARRILEGYVFVPDGDEASPEVAA